MWEFWRGKLSSKERTRASPRTAAAAGGSPRPADGRPQRNTAVVNFKDLNLSVDDELSEDPQADSGYHEDEDPTNKAAIIRTRPVRGGGGGAQKNKLIIIMVGLPGRGKTFLCNKLKCYLNWLGHTTAHFNVGNYRRLQKEANEVQDATFFDSHNKHGVEARCRALMAAIDDVMKFLTVGNGQVAIFDATNTTKERRQLLIDTFHGRCQYIFIESICNDTQVLEANYRYKMKYSPDYQGVDTEAALEDFKARITKYNEVYEPIDDRRLHYIKLIDMVTGRGYMDVNRISGYIPGKIVFFLMQVCKAGMTAGQSRKIWLTRHGESQFNMAGRIGGDSGLTARGEEYARLLPDVLESRLPATFNESGVPVSVWTSTLRRTIATANYLPYPKLRWKALDEIHAGVCDGMTYPEIAAKLPEDYEARKRDKLRYRYPSGESYLDVIQRLEPVIIEMEREREYVMVVGHQAVLRAIFGYFMAVPLDKIPRLDIPLHTLIELQPRPDGTMEVSFLPVPVSSPGARPTPVQLPLGAAPGQHSGAAPLATYGSLPLGFLAGARVASASAAAGAAGGGGGGGGWAALAAAAGHRRTASGSFMNFPRTAAAAGGAGAGAGGVPPSASFATVSSMASLLGSSHNSSSAGSLAGSSRSPSGLGLSSRAGGGSGEEGAAAASSSGSAGAGAAAPTSGAGACELDGVCGGRQQRQQHCQPPGAGASAGSPPWRSAAAGPPCGSSSGSGGTAAAGLHLQGLGLDDSVSLTSAAACAEWPGREHGLAHGGGSGGGLAALALQPSGGSGGSSSSGARSPVLTPPISSMKSLD